MPDARAATCAVVAVAAGDGQPRARSRASARAVVDGGATMNPSTADLLAAIEARTRARGRRAPEQRNVIMSAEQAAEHASKPVRVVPTRSIQAGLAAMVAFDPARRRRRERRGDGGGGRRRSRPARSRSRRATSQLNGVAVTQGHVARARRRGAGRGRRRRSTRSRARCSSGCSREPRGVLTLLDRRGRAGARRRSSPSSRDARIRSSSSRCTTAASRTTRCSSRPSDDRSAVRVVLVEDNDVFRETLELLLRPARRPRRRRRASPTATRRRDVCASSSPTSC